MKRIVKLAGLLAAGLMLGQGPVVAETSITGFHDSTSGTYMDYMKTVYARAGKPELLQLPLTAFDKEYELVGLAAESWSQSDDGLTWTINLRNDLTWSDGHPLTSEDYLFSLQRAATSGYDFAWYWDFAGGVKNWKPVTEGSADVADLGLGAPDEHTLTVTTETAKPYLPSVISLWYPVPKHIWDEHGDDYAANVDTLVSSGAFKLDSWEKSTNKMVFSKRADYNGPWPAQIDKVTIDPSVGAPEVGFPAYLAGDTDLTNLNAGQIPFAEAKFKEQLRTNAIFAVSYFSFDLDAEPFNNLDVRKALWYAVDREEMTSTVLKNLAIPAKSLLAPGFPGYNEGLTQYATFDPEKAREHLAKAGYPNGEGFPKVEVWYRKQGGYNGAITAPMLQYLQAEYKEHLGIEMDIKVMSIQEWMDALLNKKNSLFLSPYEFDYLDPSNFYGIFYNGGRHSHHLASYDELVAQADSNPNWEKRLELYEKAEMELINNVSIIPLMHPITTSLIKNEVKGEGTTPNKLGFSPLDARITYFYTHVTK